VRVLFLLLKIIPKSRIPGLLKLSFHAKIKQDVEMHVFRYVTKTMRYMHYHRKNKLIKIKTDINRKLRILQNVSIQHILNTIILSNYVVYYVVRIIKKYFDYSERKSGNIIYYIKILPLKRNNIYFDDPAACSARKRYCRSQFGYIMF